MFLIKRWKQIKWVFVVTEFDSVWTEIRHVVFSRKAARQKRDEIIFQNKRGYTYGGIEIWKNGKRIAYFL